MKVIIVHRNELSLEAARNSAKSQADTVISVSENTFAKSMKVAFEIAIEHKWTYLILMGGDQVLLPEAISKLKKKIKEGFFRISGNGYDCLLMRKRMMAPCLYNVSLLPQVLEMDFIEEIQPESYILKQMKELDYESIIIDDLLAIHDCNQYYKHIYEKGYNEAAKLLKYILNNDIIPDLEKSINPDHKVFLQGIYDYAAGELRPIQETLKRFNLQEK